MDGRLPAHVEAMAIVRRAQSQGDFAVVLRKGDADRGSLLLVIRTRGQAHGYLERVMGADFNYAWAFTESSGAGSEELDRFVASRTRLDPDSWLIELDVAQPERFIAETIETG